MAIVTNGRLEYEMSAIDVTYPDVGKVTYRGSYPLIVPNQWMPPSKMPVKGDLIMLDGKDYRVLKIDKNVAEVLCMYDANKLKFGSGNTYAENTIDVYCNNTFYSELPAVMKGAIVDKTFTQDSWESGAGSTPIEPRYTGKRGSGSYYLALVNATFGASITRHCYALSVQDAIDYLEVTPSMGVSDTTLTDTNIWKMFFNATTGQLGMDIWLRSAYSEVGYVFKVYSYDGGFGNAGVTGVNNVRPAFQIDLSKVEYTIK